MKRLLTLILIAALGSAPVAFTTGCATTPATQTTAFKTLGVIGNTAKSGMDAATQLLKQGTITVAQWQKVANFYDNQFQPTFALALNAAHADLSSIASPEVTNLAIQFVALVAALYPSTPPTP
jgi:hypothetical protein